MNVSSFSQLRNFPIEIKQAQAEMGDGQWEVPRTQGTQTSASLRPDKAQELQSIEWKHFLASWMEIQNLVLVPIDPTIANVKNMT